MCGPQGESVEFRLSARTKSGFVACSRVTWMRFDGCTETFVQAVTSTHGGGLFTELAAIR